MDASPTLSLPSLAPWVLIVLLPACGSPYLLAGRASLAAGDLPIAIELLDVGLSKEPGNTELHQTLIVAHQSYQHELRGELDRLGRAGRHTMALGRLLLLSESARRAQTLGLPTEPVTELDGQRVKLTMAAKGALEQSLDERASRGAADVSDLAACRQLVALSESDDAAARMCDRLRSRFRHLAVLATEDPSHPNTAALFPAISQLIKARHPELIEIIDGAEGSATSRLFIQLGEPTVVETGWVEVKRNAYRTWVPKLDKRGRQIVETVSVKPSAKEVERAKKNGEKPPKTKKKKKKVWRQVSGEYRSYRSRRQVTLPYAVSLRDLRDDGLVFSVPGVQQVASESRYYTYSGHPKARTSPPPGAPSRGQARSLTSTEGLVAQILGALPTPIVDAVLERVE